MANTWRATLQGGTYAVNRSMLDVFNNAAARVIRVYRMYLFNSATSSGAGVLGNLRIYRTTGASAGTAVTSIAMDNLNTALDGNVTAGYNRTVTNSVLVRQLLWQGGAPGYNTNDFRTLLTLVPFCEIWNAGYSESSIQPLTCPASSAYGYNIWNDATSLSGFADAEIEFTDAAS